MNKKNKNISFPQQKEKGAAVIAVVLILLMVLTIVGLTSAKKASIETKMTTNTVDRQKALIAAGMAAKHAWLQLNTTGFDVQTYVANCHENGVYDLRDNAVSLCQAGLAKTKSVWTSMQSEPSSWDDAQKRQQVTGTNIETTMNLNIVPQYALGIRDAIERKGTEGSYCIPMSIMGEGTGATENAKALVEVNVIPRSACFRSMVQ